MSIKFTDAVAYLQKIASIAEENDDPVEALRVLGKFVTSQPRFNDEVSETHPTTAARWLQSWGRNPASYMYRLSGGYESFLRHKYLQRRGNRVEDIPELLSLLEKAAHREMPSGAWGEHQFAQIDTTPSEE